MVMCGRKICISASMMQYCLNICGSKHIVKLRSDSEKSHSRRSGQERNNMIKLMKYIQTILTNMKEKFMHKILSPLYILINSPTDFQIVIEIWVVVEIVKVY